MTRTTTASSGQWKRVVGRGVMVLATLGAAQAAHVQAPANPYSYGRVTSYTYDAKGRVATETIEPSNLQSCTVTTSGYDAWGNRNASTVANCQGVVPARQQVLPRTTSSDYSATTGKFPQVKTNALSQTESAVFDARFGIKTSTTDVSGLTVTFLLDDFGRVIKETRPDGTNTVTSYCYLPGRVANTSSNSAGCDAAVPTDAPTDAVSYVHAEPRDAANVKMGSYTRTYSDRLGRKIREVTQSFDGANQPAGVKGKLIAKDTVYNAVGVKLMETQPYFLSTGSSTTTGANDVGVTRTVYDALGRPTTVFTADPTGLAGSQAFGGSGTGYGNYGNRAASKVVFSYAGQTTIKTNDRGQARTEEKNAIGLLVRITDPAGGQLAHQHDAFGNLVATKDALQNSITLKYDVLGRKLELNDPDAGLWKYEYDALGQLVWQQNANQRAAGTNTTMVYDKLGRMTSRMEPEGTGTWSYDKYADNSVCTRGAGRLCESRFQRAGTNDIRSTRTYYDNLGRAISDVSTVTNGPRMAVAKTYHATTGRLDTKTYPTGVKVQYAYTTMGFAYQLKLATTATVNGTAWKNAGDVLWQADVVNAWGKTEQQAWANSVIGKASYQAATGRTSALTAGSGTSTSVVNHSYTWDSLNNLTYRADNIGDAVAGAVTETFEYGDGLSRLTKYTVAAPAVPGGSRSVTLQYNALGMLLNKSDVGVYAYSANGPNAVRPHALQSLTDANGVTNYGYDANGNLVTASGGKYRTVNYTSFNLPDGQSGVGGETNGASGGTARYTWLYDENHQRIKEVRTIAGGSKAATRTTWYLHPDNAGALGFEQEVNSPTTPTTDNPTATNNRHYLSFGGQTLGVLISTGSIAAVDQGSNLPPTATSVALTQVQFWHKDHLGSLIATTNHVGAVTGRYSFDPFGKRRFTNGSYDPFGTIVVDFGANSAATAGVDRGFTGHEHLDDIGLIHMNGRIFDPKLGRFLQTDRFVQEKTDLQNYERYVYCLNNPLTCTDPSGLAYDPAVELMNPGTNWITGNQPGSLKSVLFSLGDAGRQWYNNTVATLIQNVQNAPVAFTLTGSAFGLSGSIAVTPYMAVYVSNLPGAALPGMPSVSGKLSFIPSAMDASREDYIAKMDSFLTGFGFDTGFIGGGKFGAGMTFVPSADDVRVSFDVLFGSPGPSLSWGSMTCWLNCPSSTNTNSEPFTQSILEPGVVSRNPVGSAGGGPLVVVNPSFTNSSRCLGSSCTSPNQRSGTTGGNQSGGNQSGGNQSGGNQSGGSESGGTGVGSQNNGGVGKDSPD